ncbi:MAG: CotH kinase family protein [Clostridia bacterium]|nr:CotH kinase family protein [Clostridia bacterium]
MKKILAAALALLTLALAACTGKTPDVQPATTGAATVPAPLTETPASTDAPEEEDPRIAAVFSLPAGFYESEKELTLSLPDNAPEGAYITYTTDNGEPTAKSKKYASPIKVASEDVTVIRAACFDGEGERLGYIRTATYIKASSARYKTLVVSLVTEESNLYGDTGIISNPQKSGKAWERPCHVEIFKNDGERIISQDAGIRVFGGSSRGLPQKSFRIIARKDGYYDEMKYNGKGSFEYPFFNNRKIEAGINKGELLSKYDRLVLRNGGNDSLQATAADPTSMTLTRDAVANAFASEMSDKIAYQASRFAVVYLNGEYYGILDMKEDINDDYMKNVYGLDKEKITVIKSELDTGRHCEKHDNGGSCRFDGVWFYYELDEGEDGELEEYEKICKEALSALGGSKEELDLAYAKLAGKLDTESFLEYTAICLYCCNTDWPHNNLRVWRYNGEPVDGNPYSDGKWRFTMRDMDFCFGRYECLVLPEIYTQADTDNISFTLGNYKNGAYEYDGNYPDSLYVQGLLALCLHNDEWRAGFLEYCKKLCSGEAKAKLKEISDGYAAQIEEEIKTHIKKLKGTINKKYTAKVWKENVDRMSDFAENRPAYFERYLDFIKNNFK